MISLFPVNVSRPARSRRWAFTLIELLVVIAIITVLAALLMPALSSAKQRAQSLECMANLSALGRGFAVYTGDNQNEFPAAFYYRGLSLNAGIETPGQATDGYVHWSGLLTRMGLTAERAMHCPAFAQGGLPPANTTADNLESGEQNETPGVVDDQAARCAFTVNQALFPANHFVIGFQGAYRPCRFVRDASVANPAGTITATEWTTDWRLLADAAGDPVCRSYLPVHGFFGLGPALVSDHFDTRKFGCPRPCFAAMRRLVPSDLASSPSPPGASLPRLDWIGRNHQRRGVIGSHSSNFVFADGHVANTTVFDTLQPFQWGREFYSLQPGNDISD
jgi:prepilin-type N-terminal cleavage/methylation domain-containing protein/prepilin-type processing-associated H-X9-DG protein